MQDGFIRMNMGTQLQAIEAGFKAIKSFPELGDIPVIIGECDPDGCAACSEERDPKYGYRNGTMYSSYTASSFAKIYQLMDKYQINLQGVLSWAFEFEDQPWFASFRDLATNGVNKPVLNVFRMYSLMQGKRLIVNSVAGLSAEEVMANGVRQQADINALAAKDGKSVTVMVWNYHDDNLPAETLVIELQIKGLEHKKLLFHHYRIDQEFSNSFEKWKQLGRPQNPTNTQYTELERAGQLQLYTSPQWLKNIDAEIKIRFPLPRQAVSLIRLTW
jgi:xylan 1,4-beta-xylosidase